MKKIISITCEKDFHTSAVRNNLQNMGEDLIVLERENYGTKWVFSSLSSPNKFNIYLEMENNVYELNEIGAFWNRCEFSYNSNDKNFSPDSSYINIQKTIHVNSILKYISESVPSMNKLQSNWIANSKLIQAEVAKSFGLLIPETFQGGSELIADRYLAINKNNKICIKALEAIHLNLAEKGTYAHYTSLFKSRPKDELTSLRMCPVILQNFLDKDLEMRITVIDEKVFTASIDTKKASEDAKVDWRHYDWANTPFCSFDLPITIQEKLIKMNRHLDLVYGAYDLIKTTSGEFYFLEVNPQGQWLWIEDLTGLEISKSIARWLFKAAKS